MAASEPADGALNVEGTCGWTGTGDWIGEGLILQRMRREQGKAVLCQGAGVHAALFDGAASAAVYRRLGKSSSYAVTQAVGDLRWCRLRVPDRLSSTHQNCQNIRYYR
jgi:hypothetical protein